MLRRSSLLPRSQVRLQSPPKQLQQHLETDLGNGRVVPPFAQLVPDEGVLGVRELVEAEECAALAHLLPDEVPTFVVDVRVLDAEDEGELGVAQLAEVVDCVRAVWGGGGGGGVACGVRAQRAGVDVGCEVGYAGCDARVELDVLC